MNSSIKTLYAVLVAAVLLTSLGCTTPQQPAAPLSQICNRTLATRPELESQHIVIHPELVLQQGSEITVYCRVVAKESSGCESAALSLYLNGTQDLVTAQSPLGLEPVKCSRRRAQAESQRMGITPQPIQLPDRPINCGSTWQSTIKLQGYISHREPVTQLNFDSTKLTFNELNASQVVWTSVAVQVPRQ